MLTSNLLLSVRRVITPRSLTPRLRQLGVRDNVRIAVSSPVEWPLPDAARGVFEKMITEKHIDFLPNMPLTKVDGSGTTAHFADGTSLEASAVWTIYPQMAPQFIKDAGITNPKVGSKLQVEPGLTHACVTNNVMSCFQTLLSIGSNDVPIPRGSCRWTSAPTASRWGGHLGAACTRVNSRLVSPVDTTAFKLCFQLQLCFQLKLCFRY